MSRAFAEAVVAIANGALRPLQRLLDEVPGLAGARAPALDPAGPYCGYFCGATLLHHLSGNPLVVPVPVNAGDLAAALVAAGADPDRLTLAGPNQPTDIGWTAFGLVATTAEPRGERRRALLDRLLTLGADPERPRGGPVVGAIYYGTHDAVDHLVDGIGVDLDVPAAAGAGRLDRLVAEAGERGPLPPGAHRLVHYSQVPMPAGAADEAVLDLALALAAKNGHADAVRFLLGRGADPTRRPPFDARATPLHWAAMGDHAEVVRVLLAAGADPTAVDDTFGATPARWAAHGHATTTPALLPPP